MADAETSEADVAKNRQLIEASREGDLTTVLRLIKEGADVAYADVDAQGKTALMAAAEGGRADVVRALLGEGAVWNAVDMGGKSAGDYAMEGVVAWGEGAEGEEEKNEEERTRRQEVLDTLIDAGIKSELILGAASRNLTRGSTAAGAAEQSAPASNAAYLSERLQLSESRLVDGEGGGVMMKWEGALMQAHAQAICQQGGDILNIGFGMGIIDTAIAARIGQSEGGIRSHTIVEAHPDVIARMKGEGWHEREGVRVVEGRWQDVLPQLGQYDGIFFDTYGEYYDDLREFHSHLPQLLKPSGLYSFFNGMCGDNAFFHTVYCHIVALELQQHVGLTTQFIPLPVSRCLDGATWAGVRHKYWQLDAYHLPVCYRDETEEGGEEEKEQQEGEEGEEA
ncbi:unnamed protein product [Closterium sp. NIES-64]|nr:unnamed protein product [Closterium sp. NIES-64]